ASEQAGTDRDRGGHRMRACALEFSGGREKRLPRLAALGLLHAPTKAGECQVHLGWALRRSSLPEEEDDRVDNPRAASALLLARHHPRSLRRNALARARVA